MPFVYLGVHLPFKSYRKIKVENFDLSNKTEQLREEARKAISELPAEEFDFIYCGDLLQNDDVLQEKGVENGSVVHLIQKKKDLPSLPQVDNFTEADVQQVLGIWRTVDPSNFQKVRHPEFMKNVLDANPAIRQDLWALSILKDPILLALEDALSDSSSSEDNTSPTTSTGVRSARRITADQLASALAFAGSSYNSLNSISQRDADNRQTTDPTSQPSTSGSAPASNRITSSMFMNALSEVIQSQRQREPNSNEPEPMDTSPATAATVQPPAAAPGDMGAQTLSQHSTLEASLSQYRAELEQMREMGLTDTETNLQALIVCNGNVETAVNLVFSGMNN
ncbi:hypothetical protein quinque_001867 [Culex quinquefasciatus]